LDQRLKKYFEPQSIAESFPDKEFGKRLPMDVGIWTKRRYFINS
jgi:hypothetical protein